MEELAAYLDAIDPVHRPLFDRVAGLIVEAVPAAEKTFAYKLPTFSMGKRRLHVGVWKHGVSIYGWRDRDGGFADRHPDLDNGKGTLRITPAAAAHIDDEEFRGLARAALKN